MKKKIDLIFIVVFIFILIIPLLNFNLKKDVISVAEKRKLYDFPKTKSIFSILAQTYLEDLENWFNDHIGFRDQIISLNSKMDFYLFNKIDTADFYVNKNNNLIYATNKMIQNYQGINLLSDNDLDKLVNSFEVVNKYFNSKGIDFIYVPCYDKQSIYPNDFLDYVYKNNNFSKRDQILSRLNNNDSINIVDFKQDLLNNKDKYLLYGNWSDPTHWTERGAYIGYLSIMNKINTKYNVNILKENDYDISYQYKNYNLNGNIFNQDYLETFKIKEDRAKKMSNEELNKLKDDNRHLVYHNDKVDNNLRLLIIGDSYLADFIVDDLAQSFKDTFMIWHEYINENILSFIEDINPDIIIFEDAERVDIVQGKMTSLADLINKNDNINRIKS